NVALFHFIEEGEDSFYVTAYYGNGFEVIRYDDFDIKNRRQRFMSRVWPLPDTEHDFTLPHAEFAYNRSTNRTTGSSLFFIVYGREPFTPLDLAPIPITKRISSEGEVRSAQIKELHAQVRDTILKHTGKYQARANKHRKQVVYNEGDLVWIHLRKEMFPAGRYGKLQARADGPFRVLKRINDNAYKIELPGHYNVSATFNVVDLSPYEGDSDDGLQSGVPLFQDGEDGIRASLTRRPRGRPRLPDISTCKPKDAIATPTDETLRSVLNVLPNNNSLKTNVSNKPVTFVNSDVGYIGLTLRPRGRPRLPDILTCKPKDATATPADETLRSVLNVLPNNNNSLKRTRTPTQVSSISNQTSTVLYFDVGNISLTPRPKGRQCMPDISSCQYKNATSRPGAQSPRISLTPRPIGRRRMTESSTNVTTVGSVTFISTIDNGKNLGEISGQTATK
nr:RNA-directed DNA polymerase [Tanacetum cinerariifolium]